jgi:glyoxylase-like metal-dependent hydrolase (beta-lactamase superfamily II)
MSRPAPTPIAPGVHRLGDHGVNFYLIEDPDGLVLVDAGVPAHLKQLDALLAGLGHSPADIRAVLLTHGHADHTGLARPLQEAGADLWIHERDDVILRDGPRSSMRHAKPERSLEFLNGDQTFVANTGDFVFVPRGTRHRFRNLTDEQAHMVAFFTPGGGEGLWLDGGDDPVPGKRPEFWPPERGMALGPLLGRADIDMEILPEEADFGRPADQA